MCSASVSVMSGTAPEANAASCFFSYSVPGTIVWLIVTFGLTSLYRFASATIARPPPPWSGVHWCRNSSVSFGAPPDAAAAAGVDGTAAVALATAASAGDVAVGAALAAGAAPDAAGLAGSVAGGLPQAAIKGASNAVLPPSTANFKNERRDELAFTIDFPLASPGLGPPGFSGTCRPLSTG